MAEEDLILSLRADLSQYRNDMNEAAAIQRQFGDTTVQLIEKWQRAGVALDTLAEKAVATGRDLQGRFLPKSLIADAKEFLNAINQVQAGVERYEIALAGLASNQSGYYQRITDAMARNQMPILRDSNISRSDQQRIGAALSRADDAYFKKMQDAFRSVKGDMTQTAQLLGITEESATKLRESYAAGGKELQLQRSALASMVASWATHLVRVAGWIVALETAYKVLNYIKESYKEIAEFQTQMVLAASYQRVRQNSGLPSIGIDSSDLLVKASGLASQYGEDVNTVAQDTQLWAKATGDLNAALYETQETLKFHAVTGAGLENIYKNLTTLSQQAAGAGFGLENTAKTLREVYAAAAYAGAGFKQLNDSGQEVVESNQILLEAMGRDAAAFAAFGYKRPEIEAMNAALIRAFGNTGKSADEVAEKISRVTGSLAALATPGTKIVQELSDAGVNINKVFTKSGDVFKNIIDLMKDPSISENLKTQLTHELGGTRQAETIQTLTQAEQQYQFILEKVLKNKKNLEEEDKVFQELQGTAAQKWRELHSESQAVGMLWAQMLLPVMSLLADFLGHTLMPLLASTGQLLAELAQGTANVFMGNWSEAVRHFMHPIDAGQKMAQQYNSLKDHYKMTSEVEEALKRANSYGPGTEGGPFVGPPGSKGQAKDYQTFNSAVQDAVDAKKDLLAEQNAALSQDAAEIQNLETKISIYGVSKERLDQMAAAYKNYNNDLYSLMQTEKAEVTFLDKKAAEAEKHAAAFKPGSTEQLGWRAEARRLHTQSLQVQTSMVTQTNELLNKHAALERVAQQLRDQIAKGVATDISLERAMTAKAISGANTIGEKAYLLLSNPSLGGQGAAYLNENKFFRDDVARVNAQYKDHTSEQYKTAMEQVIAKHKELIETYKNETKALNENIRQKTSEFNQKTVDTQYTAAEQMLGFAAKRPGAISYNIEYQKEQLRLGKEWADLQHYIEEEQKKINAEAADPGVLSGLTNSLALYEQTKEQAIQLEQTMAQYNRDLEQLKASAMYQGLSAGIGGLFQTMGSDIANSINGVNRINDIVGAYQMEINSLQKVNELENQSFNDTLYKTPYQEANMRLINDMYKQRIQLLKQAQDAEKNQLSQENFIQRAFRDLSTTFFTQFADKLKQAFVDAMTNGLMGGAEKNPMQQMAQAGQQYYIPAANGMITAGNLMVQAAQINLQAASMAGTLLNGPDGSAIMDTIGNGLGGGASTFAGLGSYYIPGMGTIGGGSSGVQAIAATMAMSGGGGMGGLGGILGSLMGSIGGGSALGGIFSASMLGMGASGSGGGMLKGLGMGLLGVGGAGLLTAGISGALPAILGHGLFASGGLFSLGAASPYLLPVMALMMLATSGIFGPHLSPGKNPDQFNTGWNQMAANMVGSWYTQSQGNATIDPVLQQSLGGMNELQYLDQFVRAHPGGSGLSGAELQLWQQVSGLTGGGTATGLAQANKNGGFGLTNANGIIGSSVMNWNDLNTQVTNAVTNLQDYNNALQQGMSQALVGINVFGGYGMPYAFNTPGFNPPTANYPYPGSIGAPTGPWNNPLNPGGTSTPIPSNGVPLPVSPTNPGGTQTIVIQTPINIDGREVARSVQAYQLRTSAAGYNNVT